jgi:hypothetical protein
MRIDIMKLGDKEASEYAEQFISVLREAGLRVNIHNIGTFSPPQYGILVSYTLKMSAITKAFEKAKIDYSISYFVGQYTILIGLKSPIIP